MPFNLCGFSELHGNHNSFCIGVRAVNQQFWDCIGGHSGRITLQSASSKCKRQSTRNDKYRLEIRVFIYMYCTIIYYTLN